MLSENAYAKLGSRFRRLLAIRDAEAILHWDLATMMPSGGAAGRAEQLAEMRAVQHGILSAPETGELISDAAGLDLSTEQAADLAEMKRMWARANALPEDLVTALSRACSACETVWRKARPEADFAAILPYLEDVLARVRDTAAVLSDALELSPYDALLDEYEPGGRAGDIDAVFADLAAFLPGFLARVLDR